MRDPVMRLRCPADTSSDPRAQGNHLAVDVRLPLSIDATASVLRLLPRCPCGEELAIDGEQVTRPVNAATMSRAALIREVRRLRRIERLARAVHDIDTSPWASDKRALLIELWGVEAVDGPHGRCDACGTPRETAGVCVARGCPMAKREKSPR